MRSRRPPGLPAPEPARVLAWIVALDVVLVIAHFVSERAGIAGAMFDLDAEANLPTWYASAKWGLAAMAAAWCFQGERGADSVRRTRGAWLAIALLMLGMSADETAQIHEHWIGVVLQGEHGERLRDSLGVERERGSLLWGVVFSPLLILAGGGALAFYLARFRDRAVALAGCAAAVGLLAGALILETREAGIGAGAGYVSVETWRSYRAHVALEEVFEIAAATILLTVHYAYAHRLFFVPAPVASLPDEGPS